MENVYEINGLPFFTEKEIRIRRQFENNFYNELKTSLLEQNKAWQFFQIEAPLLTPRSIINPNYNNSDIYVQEKSLLQFEMKFRDFLVDDTNLDLIKTWLESEKVLNNLDEDFVKTNLKQINKLNSDLKLNIDIDFFISQPSLNYLFNLFVKKMNLNPVELVLRPETTPGSYEYIKYLMSKGIKPPIVVWQSGKSFRREKDQPSKHCRYKEFYQQEFQCIFTEDTKNDYQATILPYLKEMFEENIGLDCRIVPSDRLPAYSLKTMDIEVYNQDKWMEICSVSLRKDFNEKIKFINKNGVVEKSCLVLEVAIGLDRCVYNYCLRKELTNKKENKLAP